MRKAAAIPFPNRVSRRLARHPLGPALALLFFLAAPMPAAANPDRSALTRRPTRVWGQPSSEAPRILAQPVGGIVYPGARVTLRVDASGTPPLLHEWRFNNTKIRGATNTTIIIPDAQPEHTGWYEVVVYNLDGESAQSERARLEVMPVVAGALDLSFSAPSLGRAQATAPSPALNAIGVQPDRKVVLGGEFEHVGDRPRRMLARLDSDGSLDEGFSAAGSVIAGDDGGEVTALALQPDGKVVVAGRLLTQNTSVVIRLNADGSTDSGFENASFPSGQIVRALALQSDGKLLVGGGHGLTRFDAHGLPDASFFVPVVSGEVQAMGVRSDDTILIQGTFDRVNNIARNAIAGLRPSGRLDVLFDPGDAISFAAQAFGLGPRGDFWVGAWYSISPKSGGPGYPGVLELACFEPEGTLRAEFWTGSTLGLTRTILVQPDSSALVGYQTYWHPLPALLRTTSYLGLRANSNGAPFRAFGPVSFSVKPERIHGDPRGAVVVGGMLQGANDLVLPSRNVIRLLGQAQIEPEVLDVRTTGPADAAIGQSVLFETSVTGVPPFFFQWRTNGVDVGEATNATFRIAEVADLHAATYTVVVRNSLAGVTNLVSQLSVVEGTTPRVSISSPPAGSRVGRFPPIPLSVITAGSPSPDRVDLLVDDRVIATLAPPNFGDSWSTAPLGASDLVARSYLAGTALATSPPVRLTTTNLPPRISLEARVDPSRPEPSRIYLDATVADDDGRVTQVEFLADGQIIASLGSPPFQAEWLAEFGRKYRITARAYDNDGENTAAATEVETPQAAQFRFALAEVTVPESDSQVTVRVLKLGDRPGSVNYATRSKSAEPGRDYLETAGSVTFSASEPEQFISVRLANDYVADGTKEFEVMLLAPGPEVVLLEPHTLRVVVTDDDRAGGSLLDLRVPEIRSVPAGPLEVLLAPTPLPNGGWRLLWETQWRRSGERMLGLEPGAYTLEFRPAGGYREPDSTNVQLGAAMSAQVQALYEPAFDQPLGALRVHLTPTEPSEGGGPRPGWRLQGDREYLASGSRLDELPVGHHVVEFSPLTGWAPPNPRVVWVSESTEVSLVASYSILASAPASAQPTAAIANYESILQRLTVGAQKRPAPLVGQLRSAAGFGTGIAVRDRVVLTAAHVLFDESTTNLVPEVLWFHERHSGQHEPRPVRAAGWYVFEEYLRNRQRERQSGLPPGETSAVSQRWDVAALYFSEPIARGGHSGYLVSDEDSNAWLISSEEKAAFGYPVSGSPDDGRMHEVPPANYLFERVSGRVFATTGFFASPGFSGAPICAPYPGAQRLYFPAAVYLGQQGGRALVRAIDSGVADLINRAASSAELGTNFTGGGVLPFVALANCPLQLRRLTIRLKPEEAVAAGAAWRLAERTADFQKGAQAVTRVESDRDYTVEFSTVPGWCTPNPRTVRIPCDVDLALEIEYQRGSDPEAPTLTAAPEGLTVAGAAGQVVDIEYAPVVPAGAWMLWTTLTNQARPTLLPGTLSNLPTNRFYRARVRN